jgi:hypothetical protein
MHKVKIISSTNYHDLESEINIFLSQKVKHEIKNIQYSTSPMGSHVVYSALITYV